jgi:hypothetical protein
MDLRFQLYLLHSAGASHIRDDFVNCGGSM